MNSIAWQGGGSDSSALSGAAGSAAGAVITQIINCQTPGSGISWREIVLLAAQNAIRAGSSSSSCWKIQGEERERKRSRQAKEPSGTRRGRSCSSSEPTAPSDGFGLGMVLRAPGIQKYFLKNLKRSARVKPKHSARQEWQSLALLCSDRTNKVTTESPRSALPAGKSFSPFLSFSAFSLPPQLGQGRAGRPGQLDTGIAEGEIDNVGLCNCRETSMLQKGSRKTDQKGREGAEESGF